MGVHSAPLDVSSEIERELRRILESEEWCGSTIVLILITSLDVIHS